MHALHRSRVPLEGRQLLNPRKKEPTNAERNIYCLINSDTIHKKIISVVLGEDRKPPFMCIWSIIFKRRGKEKGF